MNLKEVFKLIVYVRKNKNLILAIDCSVSDFKLIEVLLKLIGFNGRLKVDKSMHSGSIVVYDCNDVYDYREEFEITDKKFRYGNIDEY